MKSPNGVIDIVNTTLTDIIIIYDILFQGSDCIAMVSGDYFEFGE